MEVEAEQRVQFRREGGLLEEWIGDISVRRVQDEWMVTSLSLSNELDF